LLVWGALGNGDDDFDDGDEKVVSHEAVMHEITEAGK
jgi:hypothetical protein